MRVRDWLRRTGDKEWTCNYLAAHLGLADACAEELVAELLRLGYIEFTTTHLEQPYYQRTLAGATLSLASAARPLTRKSAQRKLAEFLERVRVVNANECFAYRVQKVLVFGSYLTEQDRINDIDVAVELTFREDDPDKREAALQAHIRQARAAGRQFSGFMDALLWPYQEVLLFLKSRSRAISLHTTDDAILNQTESRILYQDGASDDAGQLLGSNRG